MNGGHRSSPLSTARISEPHRFAEDPPVREDGRCIVCGGARGLIPKTETQRSKQILAAELAADPFCSSPCARRYHGTDLATQDAKAPAADLDWTHA